MRQFFCPKTGLAFHFPFKPFGDELCPHCGGALHLEAIEMLRVLFEAIQDIENSSKMLLRAHETDQLHSLELAIIAVRAIHDRAGTTRGYCQWASPQDVIDPLPVEQNPLITPIRLELQSTYQPGRYLIQRYWKGLE